MHKTTLYSIHPLIWIVIGVALAICGFVIFTSFSQPSVAAYCQVYKQEKSRLATLPGDSYASATFNETLSDANEFALSFEKLERVAPEDIRPDIKNLKNLYKSVAEDPSQALAAGLSGVGMDTTVKQWTLEHCS